MTNKNEKKVVVALGNQTVLTTSPGLSEDQQKIINETKKRNRQYLKENNLPRNQRTGVAPVEVTETPVLGPEDLLPEVIERDL